MIELSAYEWCKSGSSSLEKLHELLQRCRANGKQIVTTNGCFDLLHKGHIKFLTQARALGDLLIVGLNSDRSVRQLKGITRPINPEADRATALAALRAVDHVVVFDNILPNDFLSFVQPNVHCKGGDYKVDELPETEIVQLYGGKVQIIPLVSGYSTSRLVQNIIDIGNNTNGRKLADQNLSNPVSKQDKIIGDLLLSSNILRNTAYQLSKTIEEIINCLNVTLQSGYKIMICGNGGSAADAQHFSSELIGRFSRDHSPLPAIALTTDASVITGLGNDYGFKQIFARQIMALGQRGDALIVISTSGQSPNILAAIDVARSLDIKVIAFTGKVASKIKDIVDFHLAIPSQNVAQIQQVYLAVLHIICDLIEQEDSSY